MESEKKRWKGRIFLPSKLKLKLFFSFIIPLNLFSLHCLLLSYLSFPVSLKPSKLSSVSFHLYFSLVFAVNLKKYDLFSHSFPFFKDRDLSLLKRWNLGTIFTFDHSAFFLKSFLNCNLFCVGDPDVNNRDA